MSRKPLEIDPRAPPDEVVGAGKEAAPGIKKDIGTVPLAAGDRSLLMPARFLTALTGPQQATIVLTLQRPCVFCSHAREPKGESDRTDLLRHITRCIKNGSLTRDRATPALYRKCPLTRLWVPVTGHTCKHWAVGNVVEHLAYLGRLKELVDEAQAVAKAKVAKC